jgi:FkbM family methyltransferase
MSLKSSAARVILPAINLVARRLALKVVPLRTPNRNFEDFFRHVRRLGMEFKTVVDVGVAFGSPALYASMPNAKFYLVEPVPGCKGLLDELTHRLNAEAFNVAAGAADGTMEFYVHSDVSGSSAYRQLEGALLDGKKITVPVRRLDSLLPESIARPSLLKIDTQGAELEVLAGATRILHQIDMLIVETSFHEFRSGAPEFHQIVARAAELGFRAYEILEGHYRSVDEALAQVDVAFVRADSSLRSVKTFFTENQAQSYSQRSARHT